MAVEELEECAGCHEMKPEKGGESVVTHTHRIDGQAVAQDTEWVCADCIAGAEESQLDRQLEAREWAGYDAWEARAWGGI
jgi:hypothetical protein